MNRFFLSTVVLLLTSFTAVSAKTTSQTKADQEEPATDFTIKQASISTNRFSVTLKGLHQADGHAMVTLSDGTIWKVIDTSDQLEGSWKVKDEIRLKPFDKPHQTEIMILKNGRNKAATLASFEGLSPNHSFHRIKRLDTKGYFLTLDNDIDWTIGWCNSWTSWEWKLGDPLVINHSDGLDGRYLLIHLRKKDACYAKITKWKK